MAALRWLLDSGLVEMPELWRPCPAFSFHFEFLWPGQMKRRKVKLIYLNSLLTLLSLFTSTKPVWTGLKITEEGWADKIRSVAFILNLLRKLYSLNNIKYQKQVKGRGQSDFKASSKSIKYEIKKIASKAHILIIHLI